MIPIKGKLNVLDSHFDGFITLETNYLTVNRVVKEYTEINVYKQLRNIRV